MKMPEGKSYWQILMQQVGKLTKTITNTFNNIAAIFSWPTQNAVCQNTERMPQVRTTNDTPRQITTISTPHFSREMLRHIVAGYRKGLARQLSVNHFRCINIRGTMKDSDEELKKLDLEAAKAEKEMVITTLTVARLQIDELKTRQIELEAQVTQLKAADKLPELPLLDMEVLSNDLPDIIYDEDPTLAIISAGTRQLLVASPRPKKSKIPRPIPRKPKKEINGAQKSPNAKPGR